jgi:hypothetical protein
MSTSRTADVVFCIDASSSMKPCFKAVQASIGSMVAGLTGSQSPWDIRLEFIAHSASENGVVRHSSVFNEAAIDALYQGSQSTFFTDSCDTFATRLAAIEMTGDEAPLIALDTCLDLPWRDPSRCHRVVILLSDEPFEEGALLTFQKQHFQALLEKIQALKVLLFIVAPESIVFDELSQVDKSEYEVLTAKNDGMRNVDFTKLLTAIGKSVSISHLQETRVPSVQRVLYGQAEWGNTSEGLYGA